MLFRADCSADPVWYENLYRRSTALYHTLQSQLFPVLSLAAIVTVAYMFWTHRCAETLRQRFDERLKERTRLARDLHDTVLQTIQGSKMVADDAREYVNDPQRTGLALDRLSAWLDRASIEGRAALEALRGSSTEANDLEAALHRVADDCITGARMSVNIVVSRSRQRVPSDRWRRNLSHRLRSHPERVCTFRERVIYGFKSPTRDVFS